MAAMSGEVERMRGGRGNEGKKEERRWDWRLIDATNNAKPPYRLLTPDYLLNYINLFSVRTRWLPQDQHGQSPLTGRLHLN